MFFQTKLFTDIGTVSVMHMARDENVKFPKFRIFIDPDRKLKIIFVPRNKAQSTAHGLHLGGSPFLKTFDIF